MAPLPVRTAQVEFLPTPIRSLTSEFDYRGPLSIDSSLCETSGFATSGRNSGLHIWSILLVRSGTDAVTVRRTRLDFNYAPIYQWLGSILIAQHAAGLQMGSELIASTRMKGHRAVCATSLTLFSAILLCACASAGWPLSKPAQQAAPAREGAPQRCLALSGGGIRSGAVSLGVLQGLHASQNLSTFEFVATVSGGGYPVYGLITQMVDQGRTLEELLGPQSSYVGEVESHADFVKMSDIYVIGFSALLTSILPSGLEG
jgi:hypothetical protein